VCAGGGGSPICIQLQQAPPVLPQTNHNTHPTRTPTSQSMTNTRNAFSSHNNRNYELPAETAALSASIRACSGSSRHEVWQAVRASSAAPYFLDDFNCGNLRFQDGATTANSECLVLLGGGEGGRGRGLLSSSHVLLCCIIITNTQKPTRC